MQILEPKAVWDNKTESYFGRVNIHINGKLIFYRMARIARPTKSEALTDASLIAAKIDVAGINCPINPSDYQ